MNLMYSMPCHHPITRWVNFKLSHLPPNTRLIALKRRCGVHVIHIGVRSSDPLALLGGSDEAAYAEPRRQQQETSHERARSVDWTSHSSDEMTVSASWLGQAEPRPATIIQIA